MSPLQTRSGLALSVALVSAAALAYQLLLMRLLGIVHWYPFAAMIVSLALLGHGISGTVLAVWGSAARRRFLPLFSACAAGFALSAALCFAVAQRVPFNGLELVWNPGQVLRLALLYLLLSVPFLFAATCIGLALIARDAQIARLYAADLVGAGLGAAAAIGLMLALSLADGLRVVTLSGFAAAGLVWLEAPRPRRALALVLLGAAVAWLWPAEWLTPQVNAFKGLSKALLVENTRVIAERSSPLGLLDVIESPSVPLRHVPGLSLTTTMEPAPQLGMFTDGDDLGVITAWDGSASPALDYLGATTSALPFALVSSPRVLVLGAGAGADVLQALQLGAWAVVAVDLNPQRVALARETFADFAGHLYSDPRVRVVIADARGYLRANAETFDLIEFPPADSLAGAGAGVQAAADSFLYTVEALREAHARLGDRGVLAITRWESGPPRASLKLFATAVAALRAQGVVDPGRHLAAIRSWNTSTLLLTRRTLDAEDTARIAAFCDRLAFDPVHYPGLAADSANRYNIVTTPWLYQGAQALLGPDPAQYVRDYKFAIAPATDDRPFFHNFFRWRTLPELWRLRGAGAAALLDSGYLMLAAALAQAVPLALVLVLVPLLALRRAAPPRGQWRTAAYFLALGLAFLFVELALLSRFTLFIGSPLLAATVVLGTLLVFAGVGSAASPFVRARHPIGLAATALAIALPLVDGVVLPVLFANAAAWALVPKALVSAATLAPLAVVMGMPFPLGLAHLAQTAPGFLPWAWGINGCASVISALLAVLIAIDFGYGSVIFAAAALYAFAAMLGWTMGGRSA